RSTSALVGATTSAAPAASRRASTARPRNPEPPVTTTFEEVRSSSSPLSLMGSEPTGPPDRPRGGEPGVRTSGVFERQEGGEPLRGPLDPRAKVDLGFPAQHGAGERDVRL